MLANPCAIRANGASKRLRTVCCACEHMIPNTGIGLGTPGVSANAASNDAYQGGFLPRGMAMTLSPLN
jgi:hypothetical protein